MIRFVIDYGDPDNGIPMAFLVMAREKAVAIRQKVNEELIARGVNQLWIAITKIKEAFL